MVKSFKWTTSSWSNLPDKLISYISQLLENRSELLSFRGVCQNWRKHSTPLPPNILHPILPYSKTTFNHASFGIVVARSIYVVLTPISCDTNKNVENETSSLMVMAEEINTGKLVLRHPITGELRNHSATTLDLTYFKVSEVSKGYGLVNSSELSIIKVILHSKSASSALFSVNVDCIAVVLYESGNLDAVTLGSDCSWHKHVTEIYDDIVSFQGMIVAVVAVSGQLNELRYDTTCLTIHSFMICVLEKVPEGGRRRMRLVVDSSSDRLYLVLRQETAYPLICVYVLNDQNKEWEVVNTLDCNSVLFVGIDQCFFARTQDVPTIPGNFIVFTDNAFPEYNKSRHKEESIKVYNFTAKKGTRTLCNFPGLSQMMGAPLDRVLASTWDAKENEKSQTDASSKHSPNSHEAASSSAQQLITTHLQEAECLSCDGLKVEFEGVYIRSNLVSTLQKVWAKHGNILEGSSVHSKDMFAFMLESLAKVIIVLQSSSGRTLTESQCDYITSIMLDLLQARLKVEWLCPFVDKAVALCQTKPLIDDLDTKIARAEERKAELLKEIANLEEVQGELKQDRILLIKKIPFEGGCLDQCIGDGLF